MDERTLHQIIKENKQVQDDMINKLGFKYEKLEETVEFISEDQYPNNLYADLTIKINNKVRAIVEIKGSDIGANEFVRGTGQVYQYQHFIDEQISIKNYEYKDAVSVLCFPSSLIENHPYNIGLFSYPKGCVILEFNEKNYTFRKIADKDLKIFAGSRGKEMVSISSYYIRDTRIFEIYLALRYFHILKMIGRKQIDRKKTETFLKNLGTPDNNNWRNVFISLSSLGFTDNKNITTELGAKLANLDFKEFAFEIFNSYIQNYLFVIIDAIDKLNANENQISLEELKKSINSLYDGKDILYLTDSGTRYLSSWLNIMKDDFGCIEFEPHKNPRIYKKIYDIKNFKKDAICFYVKMYTTADKYIEKFNNLMNEILIQEKGGQ